MMTRRAYAIVLALALALGLALWSFLGGWYGSGPLEKETSFVVPSGASLSAVAERLEDKGLVRSAGGFSLRARIFAGGRTIKAGEFAIPAHASPSQVLSIITSDDVIRRFVTIPEGMPSIMVLERLEANKELTGKVAVPEEGSVLPDSYAYQKGDAREEVLRRMQAAMSRTLKELWAKRGKATRAEPVAVLYEQGRVSHVGSLARLEDQLTTWDPATGRDSPDRLDALVYAVTELMGAAPSTATPPKPVRAAPSWGF